MRTLIVVFICLVSLKSSAQIGIRAFYDMNQFNKWENILSGASTPVPNQLFENNIEIALDYWIRLKNYRIEFFPELNYSRLSTDFGALGEQSTYRIDRIGMGLNTHIYIFDFLGDCDCPTFSKQGGIIKKGLFMLVKPSLGYFKKSLNYMGMTNDNNNLAISISAGVGIDLGISDLVTISPIIQYSYTPSLSWDGISASHGIIHVAPPDESTSISQIQFGLRLGFRPNYK